MRTQTNPFPLPASHHRAIRHEPSSLKAKLSQCKSFALAYEMLFVAGFLPDFRNPSIRQFTHRQHSDIRVIRYQDGQWSMHRQIGREVGPAIWTIAV